jgi:hypothetical protein
MAATRRRRPARWPALLAGWCVAAAANAADADADAPEATPYRPSVSTPAALSAPGWLEVEAGVARERQGAARLDGLPATFKLAFTPDWGVRVGGDVWQRQRDGSGRSSGGGDVDVVVKRRFALGAGQAVGLEAGVTLPTAHGDTGVGRAAWGLNAIHSADFGDWHTDLNLGATRLGAPDPGASRLVVLWAAAVSRSLGERWSVVGEVSGTRQRGGDGSRQVLVAASHAVTRRFVLDAGAAHGFGGGPSAWSVFAGFTWTAVRLF